MVTKFYLIRHGESQQNSENVLSGITDVPLSTIGMEQCRRLSHFFKLLQINKVITSPLVRAKQSAEIIFPEFKSSIEIAESLIELNYGDYENYSRTDYRGNNDPIIHRWISSPSSLTFPNGDNVQKHAQKVFIGITKLAIENKGAICACVSHRTTIRLILSKIAGLDINYFRSLPCSNCGVSEIIYLNDNWQINSINLTMDCFNQWGVNNDDIKRFT